MLEFVSLLSPVSTSWHTEEDNYRAPPIDRSILPTAPRSAREPNIDRSRLPRSPPYTAFLGNLPYDVTEDSIKDFFRGLAVGVASKHTYGVGHVTCSTWLLQLLKHVVLQGNTLDASSQELHLIKQVSLVNIKSHLHFKMYFLCFLVHTYTLLLGLL